MFRSVYAIGITGVVAAAAILTGLFKFAATDKPMQALSLPAADRDIVAHTSDVSATTKPVPTGQKDKLQLQQRELEAWRQAVVAWLQRQGDADSMLAAALLQTDERQRLTLLEQATARNPDDPLLRWLALLYCQHLPQCNTDRYLAEFRTKDPANGMGQMEDLNRAVANHDDDAIKQTLNRLAEASKFNLYQPQIHVRLVHALRAAPIAAPIITADHLLVRGSGPLLVADMSAIGASAALPLPSFTSLTQTCRNADDRMRQDCRRIALTMRDSDTDFVQVVGASLLGRWMAPTTEATQEYAEFIRRRDWVIHQVYILQPSIDQRTRLLQETGNEMATLQAVLREAGVAAEPPRDWAKTRP